MKKSVTFSTGRNNIGMQSNPNSLVAQGDFPTRITTQDADTRTSTLEVTLHENGDLYEGVSEQELLNEEPGYIYVF